MNNAITQFRTSIAGILSIGVGIFIGVKTGEWTTAGGFITAGVGLIAAKDSDK